MTLPVWSALGASLAFVLWYDWLYRVVLPPEVSGDGYHIKRFAFTSGAVSPPYCWRPLGPWLARILGFRFVSYAASVATPPLIAWWIGGWSGFALALAFCGNPRLIRFNTKYPEYADALGHLLLLASVIAIASGHWSVWPLLLASALCRETLTAALAVVVLFVNPVLLTPLAIGAVVSRFARKADTKNRHPLVGVSTYETLKHIAAHKRGHALSFGHVIQPLRGLAFAVPFVWGDVDDFTRVGLAACIAIFIAAYPASGQSRLICYQFVFLAPFAAALPAAWCWSLCLLNIFWPTDIHHFDERGSGTGFLYRGEPPALQQMREAAESQDREDHGDGDDV